MLSSGQAESTVQPRRNVPEIELVLGKIRRCDGRGVEDEERDTPPRYSTRRDDRKNMAGHNGRLCPVLDGAFCVLIDLDTQQRRVARARPN